MICQFRYNEIFLDFFMVDTFLTGSEFQKFSLRTFEIKRIHILLDTQLKNF